MKIVGRVVSRGDVAGLFIPLQGGIPEGLYDVVECMGELNLRYVGPPNMPQARFRGLDLEGLFNERPNSAMTTAELEAIRENDARDSSAT